jgi:hypothetical protein
VSRLLGNISSFVKIIMDSFTRVQTSLEPFIKSRQEARHIRQVLAAQIDAQIDHTPGDPRLASLSLPTNSTVLKQPIGNVRGLRKDYLRALRSNIKARREYEDISNSITEKSQQDISTDKSSLVETNGHLDSYLALVKQRQRHQRLRILQDYVDGLSHKNAASSTYLEEALEVQSPLPRVPEDVMTVADPGARESSQSKLKDLIHDLEKSVLQAKVRSKSDKLAFGKMKASLPERQDSSDPASRNSDALEALGRTRNELIAWVEQELGKAGDSDSHAVAAADPHTSQSSSEGNIDQQLSRIRQQYSNYIQARQDFLDSIILPPDPTPISSTTSTENPEVNLGEVPDPALRILSPFLQELVLLSNAQKALLQSRSHLTVSLSKQHKESVALFDRLAQESHLLPSHPLPASLKPGKHPLANDGLGGHSEVASTAHRAKAWTFAAESAATTTMESVLMSTEEGGNAVEGARQALVELRILLGRSAVDEGDIWTGEAASGKESGGDIWEVLNGKLGVIERGS